MNKQTIALFGEAEKGEFKRGYFCQNLPQLIDFLGHPPPQSWGLFYAIQALLYKRDLIFFRVQEEGFSVQDYLKGLELLSTQKLILELSAICAPGVGDPEIIEVMIPVCLDYNSILIINEADFYDYLTDQKAA